MSTVRDPSVAYAVMCREPRTERAAALAAELGARIVSDPSPDEPPTPGGTWRTARVAWSTLAKTRADHAVVVQDDVLLCPRFRDVVPRVLAVHPRRVVTFFTRRSALLSAYVRGATLVELNPLPHLTSQAIAIPRGLIAELVEAGDALPAHLADDVRIGRWLGARGETALATVPSLAEHDPTLSSMIGHGRNTTTGARLFVGDTELDPSAIDWTAPVYIPRAGRGRRRGGWMLTSG